MGNVKASYGRYKAHMQVDNAAKKYQEASEARKLVEDQITALMMTVCNLKGDKKTLLDKSVKLADKAEKFNNVANQNKTFKESNALRWAAEAKSVEVKAAEAKLQALYDASK